MTSSISKQTKHKRGPMSEAQKKAISEGMRKRSLDKEQRREEQKAGFLPQPIQLEPLRIGTKWIYDIRFKDVGWRRYIMPDSIEKTVEYRTKDIPLAEYFKPAEVGDVVALLRGRTYSIKARGFVPVFELVYTPWIVTKHIEIKDALIEDSEYEESAIAIARLETKIMQAKYESQVVLTNAYKQQLRTLDLDIQKIAEGHAARLFATLHKGSPKPTTLSRLWYTIRRFINKWWWVIAIFGVLVVLVLLRIMQVI